MKSVLLNYAKSLALSLVITFIFIIILSLVLTYSNVSEEIINPTIIIISGLSIIVGAFYVSRVIDGRGILNGGILGIIYMMIIYLISSALNGNFSVNMSSLAMIVIGILAGATGGILGINSKPMYKK